AEQEAEADDVGAERGRRRAGRRRGHRADRPQPGHDAQADRRQGHGEQAHGLNPWLIRPNATASTAATPSTAGTQGRPRSASPASPPAPVRARPTPVSTAGTPTSSTAPTMRPPGRAKKRSYSPPACSQSTP